MDITPHNLDKIIKLLEEIKNSLTPTHKITTGTYFIPDKSSTGANLVCNCHEHKSGKEGTGGWYCPVHGQRF